MVEYRSTGDGQLRNNPSYPMAGSGLHRSVSQPSEFLRTDEALRSDLDGTFSPGHYGDGLTRGTSDSAFSIEQTAPLDWTGSDDGADRMHSLKELRSSLAICELILATVVRREPMGSEAADMLKRVATELGAAVGYLTDVAPSESACETPKVTPPAREELMGLIRQVFSSGELLGSAVGLFDVEPALGAKLKTVVGDLTETAQDVWFMAMTAASDTPAL